MSVQELENEVRRLRGALMRIAHGMDRKRARAFQKVDDYREAAREALRDRNRRAGA